MMNSSDSESSISQKKFKCSALNCYSFFTKKSKLISHSRKHTGERPFVCDEPDCNKTYTNNSHLRRHKKVSHGAKIIETVQCDFEGCCAVLSNKYSLKKHYNRKHRSEQYFFKCNECEQGFHRKKLLQHHIYLHTGEALFSCDKCDMTFTTSYNLNKHRRSHRVYTCDCGEIFHRWSVILAHKKTCKTPKFTCEICNTSFSRKANFENHKLIHKNKSERFVLVCPYKECKRFYFYKKNLKVHIDTFHKKINENQRFKCTYPRCKVVLKTKPSQKLHLQRHFEWVKRRQIRWDKGKPRQHAKKSVIPTLVGKNLEEFPEVLTDEIQNLDTSICVVENAYDGPSFKDCHMPFKVSHEKILSAS